MQLMLTKNLEGVGSQGTSFGPSLGCPELPPADGARHRRDGRFEQADGREPAASGRTKPLWKKLAEIREIAKKISSD